MVSGTSGKEAVCGRAVRAVDIEVKEMALSPLFYMQEERSPVVCAVPPTSTRASVAKQGMIVREVEVFVSPLERSIPSNVLFLPQTDRWIDGRHSMRRDEA